MVAMDTEESREQLWHRLSSESARAYEAYKVYMYLSPAERTVVGSWRLWSHNSDTKREPPFFRSWYHSHAWRIETGEGQEKSSSGSEKSEVDPEEAEGEQD